MSVADAAGNVLNVGDFIVYATGTRSSSLTFAVITDIKEDRSVETRPAYSHSAARTYEVTKVRIKLEVRNSDGTLVKEMHYPHGYNHGPLWSGKYLRKKTNLADQNTVWDEDDNPNSHKFGQTLKLDRYYKVDNITPEQ